MKNEVFSPSKTGVKLTQDIQAKFAMKRQNKEKHKIYTR